MPQPAVPRRARWRRRRRPSRTGELQGPPQRRPALGRRRAGCGPSDPGRRAPDRLTLNRSPAGAGRADTGSPRCRSTTRSARTAGQGGGRPARRCGPEPAARTASSTSASVSPSRLAVGSSSSRSGASRRKARARATRWRSPADSPAPSSPSRVSRPWGRRSTRSERPAAAAGASDSAGRRRAGPGGCCRRSRRRRGADAAAPRPDRRPPGVGVEVAEVDIADAHGPAVGLDESEQHGQGGSTCRIRSDP